LKEARKSLAILINKTWGNNPSFKSCRKALREILDGRTDFSGLDYIFSNGLVWCSWEKPSAPALAARGFLNPGDFLPNPIEIS